LSRPVEIDVRASGVTETDRQLQVIKDNLRTLQQRGGQAAEGLKQTGSGLRSVTSEARQSIRVWRSYGMLTRQASIGVFIFASMQRHLQSTTWALTDAKKKYLKALQEEGAGSEEAKDALEDYRRSQLLYNQAQLQTLATLGTWIPNLAVSLILIGKEVAMTHVSTAAHLAHIGVIQSETLAYHGLSLAKAAAFFGTPVGLLAIAGVGAAVGLGALAYESGRQRASAAAEKQTAGGGGISVDIGTINVSQQGKGMPAFMNELKSSINAARGDLIGG